MFRAVFVDPLKYLAVVIKAVSNLFKVVAVKFKKGEKMFVEPDGFVVVTIEETLAMQPCLIDQPRQVHVAGKFFVRTAGVQLLHEAIYVAGSGRARPIAFYGSFAPAPFSVRCNSACCKPPLPMIS